MTAALERAAEAALGDAAEAVGIAPGRCTLLGEHVDYADGVVACIAVDLHVAVALRRSRDRTWSVRSGDRAVTRTEPAMCGDVGDRVLAALEALRRHGVDPGPVHAGVAATLPEGAGLSSSAALSCATLVAALRLTGERLAADEVARLALVAERDIAGVPCGPLDQLAVVHAPEGGVLLLDCRDGSHRTVPWRLDDAELVACWTGASHDVGGAGYRARREEAAAALRALGAASFRDVTAGDVARLRDPLLRRRARHIVGETARALEAAAALEHGDAAALGALMHAGHASLRDDYEVTMPLLDRAAAAAEAVPGCLGARMVGAGWGGTVTALVRTGAAAACRRALEDACGRPGTAFAVHPGPGLRVLAAGVVR